MDSIKEGETMSREKNTESQDRADMTGRDETAAAEANAQNEEKKKTAEERSDEKDTEASEGSGEETPSEDENADGETVEQKLDAAKDRYIRLMAEFDNYKRRVSRDYERMIASANERLMLDIIDIRENFDRAIKSVATGEGETGNFVEGMKLIYSKLDDVLKKHGLEVFAEEGEAFDPQYHDAMMKVAHDTIPDDHIVQVFEKGYRLKGRVIKHAKVIVSSGKEEKQGREAGEEE
jgi:molecular chaperone GrpE